MKKALRQHTVLTVLTVIVLMGLGACSQQALHTPAVPREGVPTPVATSTGESISVRLTEGTQLAAAVDPATGNAVIALQGTLYFQSANSTGTRALTGWNDDAWEPSLAPDGTRVVYTGYREGTFDLWEMALTPGSKPRALTHTPYDDREPQYSPDGRRVLFSSDRSGSYDIWELTPDTGELRQLTFGEDDAHTPTWTPYGLGFAYILGSRTDGRRGSRVMVVDEKAVHRDVLDTDELISGLQWHPSGQSLSYRALHRDDAGNALTSLRLLDLRNQQQTTLTKPDADVFPFRVNWLDADTALFAADGRLKLWHRHAAITERPFVVDVELQRKRYARRRINFDSRQAEPVLGISNPAISPDGNTIAFTALGDLWLWRPETRRLRQLTDDPAADQTPAWSFDGRRLAYVSDRDGTHRVIVRDLVSNVDTPILIDKTEVSFPSWSPDGRKLAFFTDVPGNPLLHVVGQLTIYDMETRELKTLLAPMPPQPIAWTGTGSHLMTTRLRPYSARYREGLYVLVFTDVVTGAATEVVPVPHRSVTHATLSPPDNSVIYVQDGVLNLQPLHADLTTAGPPQVIVDDLADTPHLSSGGKVVVFQSGARLLRRDLSSGVTLDVSPPLTWTRDIPDRHWILRAGRLFDGLGTTYRHNVDIHIHGNRIGAIKPVDPRTTLPVVDASTQTVIPGLFESHAHIGDHNMSERQGRAWLSYGITSVRDPGSNPYLANERKEAWSSGRRIGPRTFITGHNIDGNRVYYAVVEGISSDAHLERALRRADALKVDFIKTYVRLSDRQQRRVVEFAHKMGIPVTSHELLPAAAYGVDNIEHFTGTSRRGYATKISELGRSYQDVTEVLSRSGMGMVPTMVVPGVVLTFSEQDDLYATRQFNTFYGPAAKTNYQSFMGFFGPGSEAFVDAYGSLLTRLVDRGALVGTGTDSPFTPFGTGLHAELRLYQREGLAPWKILQAATRQSARIAGVEADLGTLEPGKLADLVVIDGDPLADISQLSRITMTVKDGHTHSLDALLCPPDLASVQTGHCDHSGAGGTP